VADGREHAARIGYPLIVKARSGEPIPDARLEANPCAELTVEEAEHRG
jgi:RNA polymerase-binding transcription factor DksA